MRQSADFLNYEVSDVALPAFVTVYTQSLSFRDSRIRLQIQQGKNNATAPFAVHSRLRDNR
jgi:hypothetical protein